MFIESQRTICTSILNIDILVACDCDACYVPSGIQRGTKTEGKKMLQLKSHQMKTYMIAHDHKESPILLKTFFS